MKENLNQYFAGFIVQICLLVFLPAVSHAGNLLKVIGVSEGRCISVYVDEKKLAGLGESIRVTDPNFPEHGQTDYRAASVGKILDTAGVDSTAGVTVIGSDQYICFLSHEEIDRMRPAVAFLNNGKPILKYDGGPLKTVYKNPHNAHRSAWTWYVETIIAGDIKDSGITLVNGGKSKRVGRKLLKSGAVQKQTIILSLPMGYRRGLPLEKRYQNVTGVFLSDVLNDHHLTGTLVILEPIEGRNVTLKFEDAVKFPILIVTDINDMPLHPAFGGPFSVIFPVDTRESRLIFQDISALFFLEKITVR